MLITAACRVAPACRKMVLFNTREHEGTFMMVFRIRGHQDISHQHEINNRFPMIHAVYFQYSVIHTDRKYSFVSF